MSRDASDQVERPARESEPESAEPGAELTGRLGYLLKHVQQRLYELTGVALAPFGISGRELSVLLVLDALGPTSQRDAAHRLGVDRTTMVALIDALEAKSVVVRRPYEEDRRRNVVEFTERGRELFEQARVASDEAERSFLGPLALDDAAAERFRAQLRALL
jgi:DNA-binding MarR family transcriptional regulator